MVEEELEGRLMPKPKEGCYPNARIIGSLKAPGSTVWVATAFHNYSFPAIVSSPISRTHNLTVIVDNKGVARVFSDENVKPGLERTIEFFQRQPQPQPKQTPKRTIWAVAFLQPAILEGYPPNVTYSQKLWVHSSQHPDAILVEEIPLPNVNGSPDPIHGYMQIYGAFVNGQFVDPTPPNPENYANALCHAFISISRDGTIYLDRILSKRSSLIIPYPSGLSTGVGGTFTNTSRVIIERKHFIIEGSTVTEVPECNSFRAQALARDRIKFTRSLYTPISEWDYDLPFPYRVWALDPFCNVVQESEIRWKVFYFYPEASVGTPGFSSTTTFYPIQGYKTIVWEVTGAGTPTDENDPRIQYLRPVDGFPKGKVFQDFESTLPQNLPMPEIPNDPSFNLFTHPFCTPGFFISEGEGVALNAWPVGNVDIDWGPAGGFIDFSMPFGQYFVAGAGIYSDDDGNDTDDDELIGNG